MKITIENAGVTVVLNAEAATIQAALRRILETAPEILEAIDRDKGFPTAAPVANPAPATRRDFTSDDMLKAFDKGMNAGHAKGFDDGWNAATTEAATLRRMEAERRKKKTSKKGGRK